MGNKFKVTCADCDAPLVHECDDDLLEAAQHIYEYTPECINVEFSELPGYTPGDDSAPFFSEAFLYPLMGKMDARTILAMVNNLVRAAGLDPVVLKREAYQKRLAQEEERKRREEARKQRMAKRIKKR